LEEKVVAAVKKAEITAVRISHADDLAPSFSKQLALTSPASGGRTIGIVASRTQASEFIYILKDFILYEYQCLCLFLKWHSKPVTVLFWNPFKKHR
jgi:hypothetical protein